MIRIFVAFMITFINSNFISSICTIISNLILLLLDVSFIYISYYSINNVLSIEYKYLLISCVAIYALTHICKYIGESTLKTNLKNHIMESLWKNLRENESDKWILGNSKYFRLSFINQITNISKIFTILIKKIIPSALVLIITSIIGTIFQYHQNIIFLIIICIITYCISPRDNSDIIDNSMQSVSHEIRNISASRFWNKHSQFHMYKFSQNISIIKYIPFILAFGTYAYFSILQCKSFICIINLIINIKASMILVHHFMKIKNHLYALTDMSKYLLKICNEKKLYALTFLTSGGLIAIENLTYFNGKYCALNKVSLHINTGEIIVVAGNYGKTVFLNIIAGLLWNYKGSVFINNINISYVSSLAISKNVAYIMQIDRLFLGMSIKDNILLDSQNENIDEILEFVELQNISLIFPQGINTIVSIHTYIPTEIINKIAIARAIAKLPTAGILLIDNPTAINSNICSKLLRHSRLTLGKTIIISDKGSEFLSLANRVLFIDNSGNAYYNTKDVMPNEYYNLINSSLYS